MKKIVITVDGIDFTFNVGLADYNRYINEVAMDNKINPGVRLLRGTLAEKEQRDELNKFIESGFTMEIAAMLLKAFKPELVIEIKNSSAVSDN